MKKVIITMLLAALVLAAVPALAEMSFTAAPGAADSTMIQRTVYEGFGFVEVDFFRDVNYENPSVSVTDAAGAPVTATIIQLDDDDLTFQISNFAADATYNYTISGVRVGRTGAFTTASGSFIVPPEGATAIQKVDYDRDDREIEVEFTTLVQYEQPAVQVITADGVAINATITDWDEDSIEARLDSRLELGAEYMVTVTGVRTAQDAQFGSASFTFIAYDD
ncbi:MAG TPA: hypothetical protein IAA75_02020 [Candidatus Pullichristensenella avicola]|nr:hypothetical protein [Candidatus Pullichristensenella avicola]